MCLSGYGCGSEMCCQFVVFIAEEIMCRDWIRKVSQSELDSSNLLIEETRCDEVIKRNLPN